MDELATLQHLLRPLAGNAPEARGLMDDVAVLPSEPGTDLVVTTDAMVEGVHFRPEDPLDLVARKLLRVNLSDLAAKGATPYGYQLMTAWSGRCRAEARTLFVSGLRADQALFGLKLFGGDTVATPGPLVLSATLFGKVPSGRAISRMGARPGDAVLVSGPIGDAHLGLRILSGQFGDLAAIDKALLCERYTLPSPRLELAEDLLAHASAAMDISDGLVLDAERLGQASGVSLSLDLDRIPLSAQARRAVARGMSVLDLITGGDDYEILCTARGAAAEALSRVGFQRIGIVTEGTPGAEVVHEGKIIDLARRGWVHGA